MSFYSCNRYRLVVMLLLTLIVWQIIRLIPDSNALRGGVLNTHDLEVLEDGQYNKHYKDKVKVRVYYESLCPDTKHFFIKHLGPVTEKLSDFLNITLVPYGKAKTKKNKDSYTFTCQHGETECHGNKIHACAIQQLQNQSASVEFATCMLQDIVNPDKSLIRCAQEMNINKTPISKCANGERGSELLKMYGDDTKTVNPNFIPYIILNGSRRHQAAILKNFLLEICKLINMPLPPPCL